LKSSRGSVIQQRAGRRDPPRAAQIISSQSAIEQLHNVEHFLTSSMYLRPGTQL
jgi:hypothetical protein